MQFNNYDVNRNKEEVPQMIIDNPPGFNDETIASVRIKRENDINNFLNKTKPIYSGNLNQDFQNDINNNKDIYKGYYESLLGKGLSHNAAVGMLGSLYHESKLKGNFPGKSRTGVDQILVGSPRYKQLRNTAKLNKVDWKDPGFQINNLADSLISNNASKDVWRDQKFQQAFLDSKTPAEASESFTKYYERPNPRYAGYEQRKKLADYFDYLYKNR